VRSRVKLIMTFQIWIACNMVQHIKGLGPQYFTARVLIMRVTG